MRSKSLGPYQIEKRLATGGMAEVFVAQRLGPHGFSKRVALKCILPQHARDPDFVAMFVDEARLAAQLEHPSIVHVFDFGESDGTLFLAMEFIDGSNVNRLLRAVSANRESVPLASALHIAAEAARALAYAHNIVDEEGRPLGIVHRDVSPANLLLTKRGHVKLSDFGIARFSEADHRTDDGHVRGKLGYMSPEQVSGYPIDGRSDVFTLATVLAEMLIGEPLFGSGEDLDVLLRIRSADLSALDRRSSRVPTDVRQLLARALEKNPDERFDAGGFAEALENLMRRRNLTGRGARELARLLHRLDLVSMTAQDERAREPGARPTAFVDMQLPTGTSSQPAPRLPSALPPAATTSREMMGRLIAEAPGKWEVRLADGSTLGPLTFPELVRRVVAGEVDDKAQISRDSGELVPSREVPELARFLNSSALRWDTEDIYNADRRGMISPGSIMSIVHGITCRRETGVLQLWDGRRRKKVYFIEGKPDFVASTTPSEMLGEYLVQKGVCLKMEVDMALALLPKFEGRLGDALVGLGVLRPVQLYRAITSQVRERYLEMFRWPTGQWAFRHNIRAQEETFALGQNGPELLRDAAFAANASEVETALAPLRDRVLIREPKPPTPIAAFALPPPWVELLDVKGDMTLGRILDREAARGRDVDDVYRAFYLGLNCQLVRAA